MSVMEERYINYQHMIPSTSRPGILTLRPTTPRTITSQTPCRHLYRWRRGLRISLLLLLSAAVVHELRGHALPHGLHAVHVHSAHPSREAGHVGSAEVRRLLCVGLPQLGDGGENLRKSRRKRKSRRRNWEEENEEEEK